jgi:DNA-binding transcriptional MocR family regulator
VLWVELPRSVDSLLLFERALAAGITLVPGPVFSPKRGFTNFIRLNAAYWSPEVEAAIGTLGREAAALLLPRTRPPRGAMEKPPPRA